MISPMGSTRPPETVRMECRMAEHTRVHNGLYVLF